MDARALQTSVKRARRAYKTEIEDVEQLLANNLTELADYLLKLAKGEATMVKEEWRSAGLVCATEGAIVRQAFKDTPPEMPVLVSREVIRVPPDAKSLMYLMDKVMGKTAQNIEEFEVEQKELVVRMGFDGKELADGVIASNVSQARSLPETV
jgi:hypothetical protein